MPSVFQCEDNDRIVSIYNQHHRELEHHFTGNCRWLMSRGEYFSGVSLLIDSDYMVNCYNRDLMEKGICPLCGRVWKQARPLPPAQIMTEDTSEIDDLIKEIGGLSES